MIKMTGDYFYLWTESFEIRELSVLDYEIFYTIWEFKMKNSFSNVNLILNICLWL